VVQVDPIKPTLKAPGAKRLKVKDDEVLFKFAFKIILRRCSWGCVLQTSFEDLLGSSAADVAHWDVIMVRSVQVDPIKPMSKAPGTQRFKVKHGKLLTVFGFKLNLRRYIMAGDVCFMKGVAEAFQAGEVY